MHGLGCRRIADDLPGGRSGHRELEGGLEIGLLEDREDATAVRHLELRVQVHLAVDRVDEPVQALTGVRVEGIRLDDQNVVGCEIVELDSNAVADDRGIEQVAVEDHGVNGVGDRVDEGG